jgi:ATP-dependent Clp protease ATP-binding subunit ClpC
MINKILGSPFYSMLAAGIFFYFMMKIMSGFAVFILLLLWASIIIYILYKSQLLPESMMDLLDKYTNKELLKTEIKEMNRQVKNIDPVALADRINSQFVIGQKPAVEQIAKMIARRIVRKRKNKPICTVLLSGPTGTGKTELAKGLNKCIYDQDDFIDGSRIDVGGIDPTNGMSSLVGSPKGYAGSDSWGSLTKFIKNHPEGLILFDELEKAGKDPGAPLYKMLLSLLDEASVTEQSVQQKVDASGHIIFMTSNAAQKELAEIAERYRDDPDQMTRASKDALSDFFAPEFLARIDLVTTVQALSDEDMARICILHMLHIAKDYDVEIENIDYMILTEFLRKQKILAKYGTRALIQEIEKMISDPIIDAKEAGAKKIAIHFEGEEVTVETVA